MKESQEQNPWSDKEISEPYEFELATNKNTAPELKEEDSELSEGWLTVDVFHNDKEIVVESAIAGVDPKDIDITATPDSITIKGKRHHEEEVKKDDYLYQECYWGRFSRSVILPHEIDPDGASVNFKNGILKVRLPKATQNKERKLKVD